MHIWTIDNWKKYYPYTSGKCRSGLYTKFDKGVEPEVKRSCKEFCTWLRGEYYFPIRIPIYFKNHVFIRSHNGELVAATFFEPTNRDVEPYISIAVGDYEKLISRMDQDDALAATLGTIAHELTHYFQWVNDIKLTDIGSERQANAYARFILDEYHETREHP